MFEIERISDAVTQIILDKPEGLPSPAGEANNVFLLHGEAPALINAGHPSQLDALCRALRQLDLEVSDLERVVHTSWNIDVLGASANLPNLDHFVFSPGMVEPVDYEAKIERRRRALRDLAEQVVDEYESFEVDALEEMEAFISAYFPPVPAQLGFIPLRSGHTVLAGDFEFEVIAVPGPEDGHIALWDARRKSLFAGSFTASGLPERIQEVQAYLISLERLLDLDVEALFLNRGGVVKERGKWTLRRALSFLNNFMSNAPAVMHGAPTVLEFIERDLGYQIDSLPQLVLQLERYKVPMDELVRARMIDAEGSGLSRRYGVDVEDDRAPLRP